MAKSLTLRDVINSTFKMYLPKRSANGSCFICRFDDSHILILTCAHMLDDQKSDGCRDVSTVSFEIVREDKNIEFVGTAVFVPDRDACAVLVENACMNCAVTWDDVLTTACALPGDDIIIAGFPFVTDLLYVMPTTMDDVQFPQPLLRRGCVMGIGHWGKFDNALLLDLHINAGFSGSPILRERRSKDGAVSYELVGIVSSYYKDRFKGVDKDDTNADISTGCPFNAIADHIKMSFGGNRK